MVLWQGRRRSLSVGNDHKSVVLARVGEEMVNDGLEVRAASSHDVDYRMDLPHWFNRKNLGVEFQKFQFEVSIAEETVE